jgi:hypothetical protein
MEILPGGEIWFSLDGLKYKNVSKLNHKSKVHDQLQHIVKLQELAIASRAVPLTVLNPPLNLSGLKWESSSKSL